MARQSIPPGRRGTSASTRLRRRAQARSASRSTCGKASERKAALVMIVRAERGAVCPAAGSTVSRLPRNPSMTAAGQAPDTPSAASRRVQDATASSSSTSRARSAIRASISAIRVISVAGAVGGWSRRASASAALKSGLAVSPTGLVNAAFAAAVRVGAGAEAENRKRAATTSSIAS